ncbi:uncharacterized protein LOC104901590 [Beta vulgaris subsp. vulgaris]|uniref:uncharacterized protein LOC104901590 n=1 Tax=Beta vulgaris subsp. vulgaris TaxID=3555 RepID=UPI002036D6F7|nr:uncharacterized protein LOC104901590 [Beta vulgaris subsp. vulgaris]
MACVKSISYSILLNGLPSNLFDAKKGLRQGDPLSPFLFALSMEYLSRCLGDMNHSSIWKIMAAFHKFLRASGLEASNEKSCIYFSGISQDEATQLAADIHMPVGVLPFKYLGVSLAAKKLSFSQCKPLIDKITARAQGWMVHLLSYVGIRLQLVKTILGSMQNCWGQIFPLPKKLIKVVEAICRKFLWTGGLDQSKKSPNRLVFHSATKNCKGAKLFVSSNTSWLLRKILESRELLVRLEGWDNVSTIHEFSIKKAYELLQESFARLSWKRLICNNKATPKSKFILWMALLNRLATTDSIYK